MKNIRTGRPREYDRSVICFRCGKAFERYPGKQKNKRNFCSRECYQAQLSEDNLLKRVNQKGGLSVEERLKISEAQRKQGNNGQTYDKFLGRHTHRIVMEKKIGRALVAGEVVHHIDGNHRNNHPDNLMLFKSQSEHLKWHKDNDPNFGGDSFHV